MKTSSSGERIAGGIDQRYQAPNETASSIVNMRRDETGFGWINDRGWEPESVPNSNHNLANTGNLGIDKSRLYVWTRHRESEIYKVYKTSDGFLKYEHANTFGMTTPTYPFVRSLNFTARTSPKSDDPDEQYTPFGRFLTIVNGKDLPLKWWGRERVFPFGFTSPTPPPQVIGPYPDYYAGSCDIGADPPTSTYPPPKGGTIAMAFSGANEPGGLGLHTDDDKVNVYQYKVSFITDTGSESPLSTAAVVQWQNNGGLRTYATFIERLPVGPPGTVARRIYRTKSLGDLRNDARDQQFYLVTQINDNCTLNYTDVMPDDLLTIAAPTRFASSVISTSYRFSANWDNRMWLAGGQGNETRIIYSDQGLPEQFPTFNYFDVGNRSGGAITQIFPYYDNLLVFRERAIDVVRPGGNGTLLCTRLSGDIGTTASNTVTNVEGLGVFFLAPDGVYVFSGGTIGGSSVRLERVSDTIMKEMRRISKSSLAQATAAYSHKEKEWWCFYPVDGQTHNSRSVVFHTQGNVWSFRNDLVDRFVTKADLSTEVLPQFNVNGLSTLPDGRFIAAFKNKTIANAPVINTNLFFPGGLCVWAGSMEGLPANRVTVDQQAQQFIGDPFFAPALEAEWSSAWESFGDDSVKKRVISVEVEVLAAGNNTIQLDYAQDYREDFTSGGSNPTMVAELFDTANADAIYGGPNEDTFDKSVLTIGSTKWGERRSTRVRWDVNTGLLSWFQFRLRSSNTFQVVSYQIELVGGERRTINIRAGQRKIS
jgi:hypothetical protein